MALTDKVRRGRLEKEYDRLTEEGKSCGAKIHQTVEQLYRRK